MQSTTTADPFDVLVERQERVEKLKQALLAMSDRERRVLLRHDLRAEPLRRIAQTMRITNNQARRALASARARIERIADA